LFMKKITVAHFDKTAGYFYFDIDLM